MCIVVTLTSSDVYMQATVGGFKYPNPSPVNSHPEIRTFYRAMLRRARLTRGYAPASGPSVRPIFT